MDCSAAALIGKYVQVRYRDGKMRDGRVYGVQVLDDWVLLITDRSDPLSGIVLNPQVASIDVRDAAI